MVSLVDIAEATDTVDIRGNTLTVRGLSAANIAAMLQQFPELRKLMTQVNASQDSDLISNLIARAPEAAALIIAAGLRKIDDAPTVGAAIALPIGEQFDLLQKIIGLTFPKGVKSFLDGVSALMSQADARGKGLGTRLPEPSKSASEQATLPA